MEETISQETTVAEQITENAAEVVENDEPKVEEKPQRRRRSASLEKKRAMAGYVFVLPFILGVLLVYLPILIDSIWWSFFIRSYVPVDGVMTEVYTPNYFNFYINAFVESPSFVTTLLSSIQQLLFEVPAIIIFALFIAVVLNQKMLGRAAFRAIFFVPVIIATGLMDSINGADIATGQTQAGIDDGTGASAGAGIINMLDVQYIFQSMAIGGELVTYVVGLVNNIYNIINYSGVQMLIFLAGLQSISPSIYEACRIDGATGWETFWKVTFPMISPMILVNAIYTVIDSFTRSSNSMMVFINGQTTVDPHYAIAMYWIYFVVVLLIIGVVAAIASTMVFYQRKD